MTFHSPPEEEAEIEKDKDAKAVCTIVLVIVSFYWFSFICVFGMYLNFSLDSIYHTLFFKYAFWLPTNIGLESWAWECKSIDNLGLLLFFNSWYIFKKWYQYYWIDKLQSSYHIIVVSMHFGWTTSLREVVKHAWAHQVYLDAANVSGTVYRIGFQPRFRGLPGLR